MRDASREAPEGKTSHDFVMMSYAACVCMEGDYDNVLIFVCGIAWSLTIVQGFKSFWNTFVLSYAIRRFKNKTGSRLMELGIMKKVDKDGHTISLSDIRQLVEKLGAEMAELFTCQIDEAKEASGKSGTETWPVFGIRYTMCAGFISLLVVIELWLHMSAWFGLLNLYVFIPFLYMGYNIREMLRTVEKSIGASRLVDTDSALALWELYKGKLGV